MKWIVIISLIVGLTGSNSKSQLNLSPKTQAFIKGEFLEYNIHYGNIDAGMASFEVADSNFSMHGKPHFVCEIIGKSYSLWDKFYKVRDYYLSYIDSSSLMPSVYSRNVSEGTYKSTESYWFNRKDSVAKGQYEGDKCEIPIPYNVHDLVSMIYFMRSIDFTHKPVGTTYPLNVFFEKEWFASGMELIGQKVVETDLGKFKCLKIRPKLVEGRVFSGQDDMIVYISNDQNQVPIRIESAIFVGSIKADLIAFRNLKYPLTSQLD